MLSEENREWIKMRVSERYLERYHNEHNRSVILEQSMDCFDLFNSLNESCINFERGLEDLADAKDKDKKDYIRNFNILEVFMKALYNMVNTPTYEITAQDVDNVDEEKYADLLKNVFHKVPVSCSLSTANPDAYLQGFRKEYIYSYQKRNNITHSSENGMNSWAVLNNTINATLICYLDLCYTHKDGLYAKANDIKRAGYIDKDKYCEEVLKDNEKYFRGFKYMDIAWKDDKVGSPAVKLGTLLDSDDTCLKLTGEAGSGKTTALKRAEYLMAKSVRNSGKGAVPVYICLNELSDGTGILVRAAARKLHVKINEATELIRHNEVCLLLDGFNEILNSDLKRKVASEIDELALQNENMCIMLTDRSLSRRDMPVLTQARRLILFEMSLNDKIDFIKANSPDDETKGILLEETEYCPDTFATITTPLSLKHLIDVVRETKEIPLDIVGTYINMLMKREMVEKKDMNINYLPYHLQALAVVNNDVFSRDDALEQIALVNRIKGFTEPDSLVCLSLAIDMGILQNEGDDMLSFSTDMYHLYFYNSCRDSRLKEKLDEFRSQSD